MNTENAVPVGLEETAKFAERINPANFGFSPRLTAIVGAIIGHDYHVRDSRGGRLMRPINITSDGFVIAHSTASDGGGALLGDIGEFERNLRLYVSDLPQKDRERFERIYQHTVSQPLF